MSTKAHDICVIGDVHGHLQLGLCMAARWQKELDTRFDIILLCGDVGTFTEESQLDSTTRRHSKNNPCELEFLYQWSADPQPDWIHKIFLDSHEGGAGLQCPVVMVHGNHEGFSHLETLMPKNIPSEPVQITELPGVDTSGYIHFLPSGWKCFTPSGLIVAGVGGIERDQRKAGYHDMAYLNDDAIAALLEGSSVDVLITHQGPSSLQSSQGSETLQILLDSEISKV